MNRRSFCTGSLAALLAGSAARFSRAADPARIGLGFSLYGMKTLPLEDALRACAGIGYDSVELALLNGFPTEPALLTPAARTALREQLSTLHLRVSGLMENFSLLATAPVHTAQLERLKSAAQLAHDLTPAGPLPPIETVLGGKPAEWEQVKERMAGQLRDWAATAEASGVVIAVKAHILSAVQTPERLLWLLQQAGSPAIKAAYDYSHFRLQELPLEATLTALLPQTAFMHVKDGRWLEPKPEGGASPAPAKFEFLLPGAGSMDYRDYFSRLRAHGFRGDAVVEVSRQIFDRPGYEPLAAAREAFAALSDARKYP